VELVESCDFNSTIVGMKRPTRDKSQTPM